MLVMRTWLAQLIAFRLLRLVNQLLDFQKLEGCVKKN